MLLLFLAIGCLSYRSIDVLTDLDATQSDMENAVLGVAKRNLKVPNWYEHNLASFTKKAKVLPEGAHAATVKAMGSIVKTYVMSEAFKTRWRAENSNVPDPAPLRRQLEEDRKLSAQANEMNKEALKQQKQMMANKQLWEMMQKNMTKEQLADYEKSIKDMENAGGGDAARDLAEREEQLKQAELQYAAVKNPNLMVKDRLKKFIDLAATIDFKAQLTTKYNQKVFVNPEYEKKGYLWKLLFRAGPIATNTARDFAQAWLTELK